MRKIRDFVVGLVFLIVVAGAIRGIFFNDSKKETAPAEVTRQELSAPAAVETKPVINIPAAPETKPAITSSGETIELPVTTNRLQYFIEHEAIPVLKESFPESYDIVIVSDNEIMVTLWDENLSSDIDAIRAGNKDAIKAWREFIENDSLILSETMTWTLRGYVPGANATVVLVDSRNHDDVLLVTSFGFLFYDFEMDEGLDPFFTYEKWKEKNGNP